MERPVLIERARLAIQQVRSSRRVPLCTVLVAYVVLYGTMLIYSNFLPYVMDNNESFSTLNHARNLLQFDITKSAGLADEAVGPSPAAHPFAHTHQGNMPRLFASLLYALGARSIQLQIGIVTFTVGLATVLMAFGFWKRQAGQWFAMTASLFLITDYIFFAQWQVNTYRVWIVFLVFSTLWTVLGVGGSRPRLWAFLTFLNALLVLYGELVFAVFALSSGAIFAAWEFRRRWRPLAVWAGATAAGALLGLTILIGQLIAYYGFDNLLIDAWYTFLSRNTFTSDSEFRATVLEFYSTHNIAFFHNFARSAAERSLAGLMRALSAHLEIVTPAIFLLAFISLLGGGLSVLVERLQRSPLSAKSCWPIVVVAAIATLGIAAVLFMFNLLGGNALFETASESGVTTKRLAVDGALSFAFAGACFALLSRFWTSETWLAVIRVLSGALLLFVAWALLHFLPRFYTLSLSALWGNHLLLPGARVIATLAIAACALAWTWRILFPFPGPGHALDLVRRIAPFLLSGLVGFAIVYGFSPGYTFSGYLYRSETFLVAQLDAVIAAGLYLLIALAIETRRRRTALDLPRPLSRVLWWPALRLRVVVTLAAFSAFYLGAQWLYTQARYARFNPPDQFSFVRLLADDSLKGMSVASSAYAIPFAWVTGSWGYLNPRFGRWEQTSEGLVPSHDLSMVWLADRATNDKYRWPDLFVCYANLNLGTVAALLEGKDGDNPCRPERVFKSASGEAFSYEVIGWGPTDGSLHAPWGIYRMNWPKRMLQIQEPGPVLGSHGAVAPLQGGDR